MSDEDELNIWRCGVNYHDMFDKLCPLTWKQLQPTDYPSVRFCKICSKNVYEVVTPIEFVERAKSKDCVAIFSSLTETLGPTHMMGKPPPWNWNLETRAKQWWSEVEKISPNEFGTMLYKEADRRSIQALQHELAPPKQDSSDSE